MISALFRNPPLLTPEHDLRVVFQRFNPETLRDLSCLTWRELLHRAAFDIAQIPWPTEGTLEGRRVEYNTRETDLRASQWIHEWPNPTRFIDSNHRREIERPDEALPMIVEGLKLLRERTGKMNEDKEGVEGVIEEVTEEENAPVQRAGRWWQFWKKKGMVAPMGRLRNSFSTAGAATKGSTDRNSLNCRSQQSGEPLRD